MEHWSHAVTYSTRIKRFFMMGRNGGRDFRVDDTNYYYPGVVPSYYAKRQTPHAMLTQQSVTVSYRL